MTSRSLPCFPRPYHKRHRSHTPHTTFADSSRLQTRDGAVARRGSTRPFAVTAVRHQIRHISRLSHPSPLTCVPMDAWDVLRRVRQLACESSSGVQLASPRALAAARLLAPPPSQPHPGSPRQSHPALFARIRAVSSHSPTLTTTALDLVSRARPDTRSAVSPPSRALSRKFKRHQAALNALNRRIEPLLEPSRSQNRFQARFSLHFRRPTARSGSPARRSRPNGAEQLYTDRASRTEHARSGFALPGRVQKIARRADGQDGVQNELTNPSP